MLLRVSHSSLKAPGVSGAPNKSNLNTVATLQHFTAGLSCITWQGYLQKKTKGGNCQTNTGM